MSPRQALLSLLHLFVVFSFLLAGLFFLSLPYLPELKTHLLEKSNLLGLLLTTSSLLLLLGFYSLNRGRYLVIRMGVAVDLHLIRQTVEDCFARQFSKTLSLSDIEIGGKSRLEIKVSVASLDDKARIELFAEAEKQLSLLLRDRFGYTKPFYFIAK